MEKILLENKTELSANNDFFKILFFTSSISIMLAILFVIMRFNRLSDEIIPVLSSCSLLLSMVYLSFLIQNCINRKLDFYLSVRQWEKSPFFLITAVFFGFVVLGFLKQFLDINITYIIILSGIGCFIWSLWVALKKFSKRDFLLIGSATFVLGFTLAGMGWGSSFLSPNFTENFIIHNSVNLDTLFHAAISGMIKTYNIPSTGLFGVPYYGYHIGSHFIVAQLSRLLSVDVITFYNLALPIVFYPLFIFAIFGSVWYLNVFFIEKDHGNKVREAFNTKNIIVVLLAISCLVFPFTTPGTPGSFIFSESYLFSLIFGLTVSLTVVAFFMSQENFLGKINYESQFLYLFLPVSIIVIGFLKISVMVIFCTFLGYGFLRYALFKKLKYNLAILLAAATSIVTLKLAASGFGEVTNISFFHFYKTYSKHLLQDYFLLGQTTWLIIFSFLFLVRYPASNWKDLKEMVAKKKTVGLEVLWVITFIGFLPGLILEIGGGSAWFFMDVHKWPSLVATIFILGEFSFNKNLLSRALLICLLLISFLSFFQKLYDRTFGSGLSVVKQTRESSLKYNSSVENSSKRIMQLMQKLNQLPLKKKRNSLVYIPKDHEYWHTLKDKRGTAFLLPAFAGMAHFDGVLVPLPTINHGYSIYWDQNTNSLKQPFQEKDIYQFAFDNGFKNIIFVSGDSYKIVSRDR